MGAVAQLSHATVEVEPGRSATFAITVRNTETVVDRFTFEALGAMAAWVTFAPPTLSLFPEASGTVNIIVAPPRDPTVTAGAVPLGVRVSSAEDAAGTFVEETTVNVAPFSEITVELVPRVARGRIVGRTQMAVDNRSNCAYRAELSGTDPQAQLAFAFRPPIVDVSPGAAAFVKVGLRPRSRFWKGPEKTIPFRLTLTNEPIAIPVRGQTASAEPDTAVPERPDAPPARVAGVAATGAAQPTPAPSPPGPPAPPGMAAAARRPPSPHREEITTDGSMLHGPLLPRWLLALVAALVGLAVLLLILWYALFRPQIRSTAQNEVNKQLTANGITPVSSTGSKSGGGTGASSGGSGQSGSGNSSGSSGAGSGAGSTAVGSGGTINAAKQATGNGTFLVFKVPAGRSLQMTDLLVENSAGSVGNLALARNGTPVMQWAMANFRDLDYHWITPTVFGPGTQVEMIVSGCTGPCNPGIYYAGHLVSG
jgi:hypothetical protein